jgi:hypothetical protein
MTNSDKNGHYPLTDIFGDKIDQFEKLWKNHFSFAPELNGMTWEQRENLKSFAKRIFKEVTVDADVQNVADTAYDDGYNDGKTHAVNTIKDEFRNITNGLIDNVNDQIGDCIVDLDKILDDLA